MLCSDSGDASVTDDEGSAHAPAITGNVNALVLRVDRDKLPNEAGLPELADGDHKAQWVSVRPQDMTIQKYQPCTPASHDKSKQTFSSCRHKTETTFLVKSDERSSSSALSSWFIEECPALLPDDLLKIAMKTLGCQTCLSLSCHLSQSELLQALGPSRHFVIALDRRGQEDLDRMSSSYTIAQVPCQSSNDKPCMDLCRAQQGGWLHPELERQACQGALLLVSRDMSHQGQVLDQATALALRGVCRAQHAPLTGLQGSWTTNLRSNLPVDEVAVTQYHRPRPDAIENLLGNCLR